MPRVSIGMPVWNGEAFIRHGLDSLLGQTFGDIELIISDNASTDGTRAICEEYARRDPRVRYHRNEVNTGLQGNFAKALELAVAPYFMWGCHDDHWDPTYVARMVDVLDTQESVVLAGSNAASIDQDGVRRRVYDNVAVYGPSGTAARARRFIRARPGGGHATLIYGLMRTPIIQRIGFVPMGTIRYLNRGYYAIDLVTVFRMLFEGEFVVSDEILYSHRDVIGPRTTAPSHGMNGRFGLHRVSRLATSIVDVHNYYGDLRTIVGGSDLDDREKASLNRETIIQELRYYPALARSLMIRRFRRT